MSDDEHENDQGGVHIHTAPPERDPLDGIFKALPDLSAKLHVFKAPGHDQFVDELSEERIIVLTSFQTEAAWAAGYSLACDRAFADRNRGLVSPSRSRVRSSDDLDLN